jgi:hypothetical protein
LSGLRQAGLEPILVVGTAPGWLPAPDVVSPARGVHLQFLAEKPKPGESIEIHLDDVGFAD